MLYPQHIPIPFLCDGNSTNAFASVAPKPVSQKKLNFEHARPRWFREMAAEAIGVFFYVFVVPTTTKPARPTTSRWS